MIGGEDLVLARVSIDSSGVVRGQQETHRATAAMEADVRGVGTASAAATQAMALGFAVAGAAVIRGTYEIARHADAWKGFEESVKKTNHAILNVVADFSGINSGLETATEWMVRFEAIASRLKDQSINQGNQGLIASVLAGAGGWVGLFQNLNAVGSWMDKRLGTNQAGTYGPDYRGPGEVVNGTVLPPRTWPGPSAEPFGPNRPAAVAGPGLLYDMPGAPEEDTGLDALQQQVAALTGDVFHLEDATKSTNESWKTLSNFMETGVAPGMEIAKEAVDDLGASLTALQTIAFAVGEAVAESLFESGTSMKEALGEALMGVAKTMTAHALTFAALGAAASTPWGAVWLGPPGPYFKAAAAFGVAAAGSYAAASALGARRGGSDSGASGGGGPAAPNLALAAGPSDGGMHFTFNIMGSYLGTSEEKIAREFARLVRKGQRDGA